MVVRPLVPLVVGPCPVRLLPSCRGLVGHQTVLGRQACRQEREDRHWEGLKQYVERETVRLQQSGKRVQSQVYGCRKMTQAQFCISKHSAQVQGMVA